jgi:hypothetical protein
MKKLPQIVLLIAAMVIGSAGIATDALARGGHGGGGQGGGHGGGQGSAGHSHSSSAGNARGSVARGQAPSASTATTASERHIRANTQGDLPDYPNW